MPETAVTAKQRIPDYERLTAAKISLILKLDEEQHPQTTIATLVGCTQPTVSRCLTEFADTRHIAKRIAHKAAEKLTKRVIDDADVDQSLEVLDRIGVLEKRHPEAHKGGNVNIVFGNPGQPAGPEPVLIIQQDVHTDA